MSIAASAELVILFQKNLESFDHKSNRLNQQDTGEGGEVGLPVIKIMLSNFSIKVSNSHFHQSVLKHLFWQRCVGFQMNLFSFPVHGAPVLHSPTVIHLERPSFRKIQRT